MPCPIPQVLGLKCLHLPVRTCGKVLLLVAWIWLVLPSTASSGGMLPLELWCQVHGGCPEDFTWSRPCFVEDVPIGSLLLRPLRLGWGICMEWGLAGKLSTTSFFPMVTVHIDQRGCPRWLPCHLRWQVQIPTLPGRWQAYRVCHLPGERVQQRL